MNEFVEFKDSRSEAPPLETNARRKEKEEVEAMNQRQCAIVSTHTTRRLKLPIFKGTLEEDPITHIARFVKMLCANHE